MANKIIPCSFEGKQKSVSMDNFLFEFLVVSFLHDSESCALEFIRQTMKDNWGKSSLSKIVQHSVILRIVKTDLVEKVLKTDKYSQSNMEL